MSGRRRRCSVAWIGPEAKDVEISLYDARDQGDCSSDSDADAQLFHDGSRAWSRADDIASIPGRLTKVQRLIEISRTPSTSPSWPSRAASRYEGVWIARELG